MYQAALSLFLVASASLVRFGLANPVPDTADASALNCSYESSPGTKFTSYNDQNTIYHQTTAVTAAMCALGCDQRPSCGRALFFLTGECRQYINLAYPGDIPTSNHTGTTVIKVVPNSCDKKAAIPDPHPCSERTVTSDKGCKYKVSCDVEISKIPFGYFDLRASPEKCADLAGTMPGQVGFEWIPGGGCYIRQNQKFAKMKTNPRKQGHVWQLINGSCDVEPLP